MTLVTAKNDDRMKGETQQLAKSIVGTVREPLVVLDGGLRVRLANRSFYRTFRVTREETEGVSLFGLGDGHWDIPELRSLLRLRVAARPFSFGSARRQTQLSVTVSLGVAALPDDAATAASLVAAADRALYAAKRGGRNRSVRFRDLPERAGQTRGGS